VAILGAPDLWDGGGKLLDACVKRTRGDIKKGTHLRKDTSGKSGGKSMKKREGRGDWWSWRGKKRFRMGKTMTYRKGNNEREIEKSYILGRKRKAKGEKATVK